MKGRVPGVGADRGLLYGLGLFLIQDELVNAAAGFSANPKTIPGRHMHAGWSRIWFTASSRTQSGMQPRGPPPDSLSRARPRCPKNERVGATLKAGPRQ